MKWGNILVRIAGLVTLATVILLVRGPSEPLPFSYTLGKSAPDTTVDIVVGTKTEPGVQLQYFEREYPKNQSGKVRLRIPFSTLPLTQCSIQVYLVEDGRRTPQSYYALQRNSL